MSPPRDFFMKKLVTQLGLKYSITFRPLGVRPARVLPRTLNSGFYIRAKMKKSKDSVCSDPSKRNWRERNHLRWFHLRAWCSRPALLELDPSEKTLTLTWFGVSGVATPIGLPDWSPTITLLNGLLRERRKWQGLVGRLQWRRLQWWNAMMPSAAVGEVPLGLRLSMISRPMGLRHQFSVFLQWIISTPTITSPMLIVL